ncbi:Deoxyhypusine synthase [Carex littledalei]|uniref:Deoxyhypusine synthase n=1 Tax=Carex littledalei TaxID=544730 RepID=A0A833VF95_9POAL|nr:Deoxyhypusine synthase [Carex littledalei]
MEGIYPRLYKITVKCYHGDFVIFFTGQCETYNWGPFSSRTLPAAFFSSLIPPPFSLPDSGIFCITASLSSLRKYRHLPSPLLAFSKYIMPFGYLTSPLHLDLCLRVLCSCKVYTSTAGSGNSDELDAVRAVVLKPSETLDELHLVKIKGYDFNHGRRVDVIVKTAVGIEEGLIKCLAPTYQGEFSLSGAQHCSKGLNRISNLLVPNNDYCKFEN